MPINSFSDYYMSWKPKRDTLHKPIYKSLAKLLIEDILNGTLPQNTRLPPQRELADYLDLNLSTISKAYQYCEQHGYLYGIVGSGTFVSSSMITKDTLFTKQSEAYLNIGLIEPFYQYDTYTLKVAQEVLKQDNALTLFGYSNPIGSISQIHAAMCWLDKYKVDVTMERIAILPGVQNALTIVLLTLFQAGDKIAVDMFTYTHFKKLALLLKIQLVPIPSDHHGILPNELTQACKRQQIKGVFIMPTCSNPTMSVMSLKRKQELATIIKSHRLFIIEDETYAFLLESPIQPFVNILPEQTIYMSGVSKALSAGLRIAFVVFPAALQSQIIDAAVSVNIKSVSLNAEITAKLIDSRVADKMVSKKKELVIKRDALFRSYFPSITSIPSYFQWLPLPKGMTSEQFESKAKAKGVHVVGSHHFVVGIHPPNAYVRISLSSLEENELKLALAMIKELMDA